MEVYRQNGRYAATIEPKIIELPDKRVDLIFEVDEGPLIKISKVKFIGNQQFSDRALRNVITSRERKWYIFFSGNDKYDAARLALDEQQLREFYLQNGFADFGVLRSSGELLPDRSGFVLTFLVDEGQQYTVSDVVINSGIENVDADTLLKESTISVGDIYDVRYLDETLSKLTDKLGEFGYAFVNVEPDFELDKENASLQVIINIDRAQRNFVEEIRINGNDRTLDRVIRRRFEIVEGDSFNQLRLSNSIRNIRNLGYFSNVQSKVLPGSQSDQSVIDLTVEEQSTGTFSLGFGYSSLDDASVQIGIEESNFLGTGRGVRASAAVSSNKTNFRLGITEPYLWDRELLGSIDAFRDENKYSDVTIERLGLDTAVGFRARDNYYHRISYLLAETQTSTSSTTATSTSGDDGGKIISELGYTLSQDKRDNRFDPREGYYWRLSNSFSGIGGDVQYIKSTVRGQYFMPFAFKRAVLGFDGKIGVVDGLGEDVSRSNRFVIGGRDIRGFESDGIGPRDTGDDSAVGGNQYYSGSVNIVSDLGLDPDLSVRWTVFYDFGSLWGVDNTSGITGADDDMMRSTFGYGFFWDTAIGPLTFSWTVPISEESYDETQSFQFSFGGRF
jgi:outer membrane protein insertion porin family